MQRRIWFRGDCRKSAKKLRRQMEWLAARTGASDHQTLDQVAELSDVSGPTIPSEHGQSCVTDLLGLAAISCGKLREEMACQNGDILDAFAQGRNREGYYVQPVKQVFAEKAPTNLLF